MSQVNAFLPSHEELGKLRDQVERLEQYEDLKAREIAVKEKQSARLTVGSASGEDAMGALIEADSQIHYSVEELRRPNRAWHIVQSRQRACVVLHEAGYGFSEIGRYLRRDHGTILYAVRAQERKAA